MCLDYTPRSILLCMSIIVCLGRILFLAYVSSKVRVKWKNMGMTSKITKSSCIWNRNKEASATPAIVGVLGVSISCGEQM